MAITMCRLLCAFSIQEELDNIFTATKEAKALQKETYCGQYYAVVRVLFIKNSG